MPAVCPLVGHGYHVLLDLMVLSDCLCGRVDVPGGGGGGGDGNLSFRVSMTSSAP